jgi:hypothetical protein
MGVGPALARQLASQGAPGFGVCPPSVAAAAGGNRAEGDPAQHSARAQHLRDRRRVPEGEPAHGRPDHWLEVDEGTSQLGGDPALAEGKQPERQQRADRGQGDEGQGRGQRGRRRRRGVHDHCHR